MERSCAACGVTYRPKRSRKVCSDRCEKRLQRMRADGVKVTPLPERPKPDDSDEKGALVAVTTSELEAAGRLGTSLGQQAIALAARIEAGHDTGSSVAALSKELRAVMGEALAGAETEADPVDELRAVRERKRNAG